MIADMDEPESRAALLGEAIRYVAPLTGPVSAMTLATHLMEWSGKPEEFVGVDVYSTVFLMARSGLFDCSSYDPASGEMSIGKDTMISASRRLTFFVYGEPEGEEG